MITCERDGCEFFKFNSFKELQNHRKGHRTYKKPKIEEEEEEEVINFEYQNFDEEYEKYFEYQNYKDTYANFKDLDTTVYVKLQRKLYSELYGGEECLSSTSVDDFVKNMKVNHDNKQNNNYKFFSIIEKMGLSDANAQCILDFIFDCGLRDTECLDKKWNIIQSSYEKKYNFMKYKTAKFSYPAAWEMDKSSIVKDNFINFNYLDPIEQIGYKLVDPDIMILNKDKVLLRAAKMFEKQTETELKDSGNTITRVIGPPMTADWALNTQEFLHKRDPNGILIPFIIYYDGVSVGHFNQVNQTPCLATIGNFSDSLLKCNLSKINLGFLPQLSSFINIAELKMDLNLRVGYSITKASEEIDYFQKEIEREYWKHIFHSITTCWERGIQLYILGHGIQRIYTCCPYPIGDDPAQRQLATIKQNACISCTFMSYKKEKYNDKVHSLRDFISTQNLCVLGEKGMNKLRVNNRKKLTKKNLTNEKLTTEEIKAIEKLDLISVHPIINIMNHVPMGVNNHIYIGVLDILHCVIGGHIKSGLTWIQRIINQITRSNDTQFKISNTLYDTRVSKFPIVPVVPHVEWTTFKTGLSHMSASEKKNEKKSSTGNGGGYRTSALVPALIQTYFAIGYYGDILPVTDTYKFCVSANKNDGTKKKNKINFIVKNVTFTCLTAIKDLLNFYFNLQKHEITENDISEIIKSYEKMYDSMIKLWNLKELLILNKPALPDNRKLHDPVHLRTRLLNYGIVGNTSTSSFESYHKFGTVKNWGETSGRKISRDTEMLNYIIKNVYLNANTISRSIITHKENYFKKSEEEEGFCYSTVNNTKSYEVEEIKKLLFIKYINLT